MIYLLSNRFDDHFIFNTEEALKKHIHEKEMCFYCRADSLGEPLDTVLTTGCGSRLTLKKVFNESQTINREIE